MARLALPNDLEIAPGTLAAGGKANFTIDPTGVPGRVEIWERVIPFPPPGPVPPPPAFASVGVFNSTTPMSKTVPLASLYQVRLYREGEGTATGDGNVLDQLNFPCVLSEQGRSNFLTRCADAPQIDITAGGTFVSLSFGASKLTMSRAQLAVGGPHTADVLGYPVFPDGSVVATVLSVSTGPKLLHTLALSDERMLPGHTFPFVILVWDSNGNWDFVWNPDAATPPAQPKPITTKKRSVDVRLTKLYYLDDSDSSTFGEGNFTLVVQHKAPPAAPDKVVLQVGTFATGTSLTILPPTQKTFGPEVVTAATRNVSVQVKGFDDDSDTPLGDDNDLAETAMTPLRFPIGEGKEEVIDRLLSMEGNPSGGDDDLHFVAEVLYSVKYQ
jgi:hypothetical protein